jgi:hypothetical protein
MITPNVYGGWIVGMAAFAGKFAAPGKTTAAPLPHDRHGLSWDRTELALNGAIDARHQSQERGCVRVIGALEDVLYVSSFDQASTVHDLRRVAGGGDHSQIVADYHERHAQFLAQPVEQHQNLRLHRHIERCGRLIGNQQFRLTRNGDSDHDSLAHPTAELLRQIIEATRRLADPDQFHQFLRPPARGRPLQAAMVSQRLGYLLTHAHDWVQRGKGILKHHCDLATTNAPQLPLGKFEQVYTFKKNLPRGDNSIQGSKQAHDTERGNALTAATFTDDANRLSVYERKRHVINRVQGTARGDELRAQVFDVEEQSVLAHAALPLAVAKRRDNIFKAKTVKPSMIPGMIASHHATAR